MKNKEDVCLVVQARLGSERLPGKMLKPFAESNLVDILFKKLKKLKNIPQSNIFFSAYEQELKDVAIENRVNIYDRSEESANSEGQPLSEIYEWYNVLPFKYVVLVSACNPLLKVSTIDDFIESFINSEKEGGFAVFEKKTYYWDKNFKPITDWKDSTIMNTKYVDPIYEAAHCLYASKMDFIAEDFWMDNKSPAEPELFTMDEIEAFDIDHEWQFKVAEILYDNIR
jgi:CMP-N-acetylneuraminic acid synthetase